ncbi:hypothetical protein V6N12_058312 [Hibiscus sabdariffa]|uniref:RNase H type-1 domain-containing protein n=1 Tax=Hibiscus sabdariffa TaxID=183260 RepID=A0ABR2ERR5_9ROSI
MLSVFAVGFHLISLVRVVAAVANLSFIFSVIAPLHGVFGSLSFLARIIWFSLVPPWSPGSPLILKLLEALGPTYLPGLVYSHLSCGSCGSVGMTSFLMATGSFFLSSTRLVLLGLPILRKPFWFSCLLYSICMPRSNGKRRLGTVCVLILMLRFLFLSAWVLLVVFFVILLLARSMGIPRLQVQSDSSVAVRMVLNPMAMTCPSPLVRAIALFSYRDWFIDFTWVSREQNMVADGMSKLFPPPDYRLATFDAAPEIIRPLLAHDRDGIP